MKVLVFRFSLILQCVHSSIKQFPFKFYFTRTLNSAMLCTLQTVRSRCDEVLSLEFRWAFTDTRETCFRGARSGADVSRVTSS